MKQTSILDYASQTAQKLSMGFRAVGLGVGLVLAASYSIYHHFSVADTVLNIAKTNLAQSIQIGGTYYQSRLASSMIKTEVFEHVWIFDSNKSLIVKDGKNIESIKPESLWHNRFYTKGFWPYALIRSAIDYHGQHAGTLFVAYKLPLVQSFVLLIIITSVFLLLSCYLKLKVLRLGKNIASPVFAFMNNLEESLKENKFTNKQKGRSFKELEKFENWLRDFFIQAKKSDKIARKALADAQTAKIASQVRHDIQGALMIANSAIDRVGDHHDEVRILKASLDRVKSTIQDIPKIANLNENDILSLTKNEEESDRVKTESCHLLSIINQVVNDFSLTSKNIYFKYQLEGNVQSVYVDVNYIKLERVLINLYKNAIEAIDRKKSGSITTKVKLQSQSIELSILDNGHGVPDHILKKLGKKGVTFGKENGTGLGVYDAYEQLKEWGASIEHLPRKNGGTEVKMIFSIADENSLFPSEILLPSNSTVVILDDDPSVHESWKQRFSLAPNQNVTFKHFLSPNEAQEEIEELKENNLEFIFLGDYDLRDAKTNGIDFITRNHIEGHSILVTSSMKNVLSECRKRNIPLISKSTQSYINIHATSLVHREPI